MTPRGLLLGLLAAAACSRPAQPADKAEQERAAYFAAYESGFMSSCVAAVRKQQDALGSPPDAEAAKTACGCAWPSVREAMLFSLRPETGVIDALNYKVRVKALMAEQKKFADEFLRSDEGRKVVKRCAIH